MKRFCAPKALIIATAAMLTVLLILVGVTYIRDRKNQAIAVEALAKAAQRMVTWCERTANGSLSYPDARAELYPMASEMYDAMCGMVSCGELDPVGLKIYAAWTVEMALLNPGEAEFPMLAQLFLPWAQDLLEACSEAKITRLLQNELREFQYNFAPYCGLPDV